MFSDALLKRPENIQQFASGELDKQYIVLYADITLFSVRGMGKYDLYFGCRMGT